MATKAELAEQLVSKYKKPELEALLAGSADGDLGYDPAALERQASDLAAREQALAAALQPFAQTGQELVGRFGEAGAASPDRNTPHQGAALVQAAKTWTAIYGAPEV